MGMLRSSGVTGSTGLVATPSTETVIEVIGAVDEKSATTRTGELTVLVPGETMVAFWAKPVVAESRNTTGARMWTRFFPGKTILQFFNWHVGTVRVLTTVSYAR